LLSWIWSERKEFEEVLGNTRWDFGNSVWEKMIMSGSTRIKIRSKGTVTIPIQLRRKYGLVEGDVITLIDLGDGSLLFTPTLTRVDRLGDRIAQAMAEEGISLEEIMSTLDEERERYYQERYAED
jgi:bifunctional DNA-binding transcriptional regulator/antitoxin component of YhaV-PrlF toxin-antitoxin module